MQKDFIIVAPDSGTGTSSVNVMATENESTLSRDINLTIAGGGISKTLNVFQEGNNALLQWAKTVVYDDSHLNGWVFPDIFEVDGQTNKFYQVINDDLIENTCNSPIAKFAISSQTCVMAEIMDTSIWKIGLDEFDTNDTMLQQYIVSDNYGNPAAISYPPVSGQQRVFFNVKINDVFLENKTGNLGESVSYKDIRSYLNNLGWEIFVNGSNDESYSGESPFLVIIHHYCPVKVDK